MQSGIDAEHIISMGALSDRVTITGNTKYDETYVEVSEEEKQQLRHEFHFDGKGPVIVAGVRITEKKKLFFVYLARF